MTICIYEVRFLILTKQNLDLLGSKYRKEKKRREQ
jgi:hypothetical protein